MHRWTVVERWVNSPKLGAEIGVKGGPFISYLLSVYQDLVMYAVDPWEDQPGGNEDYIGWDWNSIYSQYKSRVRPFADRVIELREYSQTAAAKVPDGALDFVFIDAQHDYESVKNDISLWRPKIKPGGLLSGHDYEPRFPGVIRAADEAGDVIVGTNAVWGIWC